MLQSGGQNQKWPTSGAGGYITPASLGCPHGFRAGDKIRGGPQVGWVASKPSICRSKDVFWTIKKFYCLRQCTSKRGCQSAIQSLRQASNQSDRNTQFGFFVSGRCVPKQWGDTSLQTTQRPNGNASDQCPLSRRFEPRSAEFHAAAAAKS